MKVAFFLNNFFYAKVTNSYQKKFVATNQEAKYVESWPNTTSAWAGWSRPDIPVER
jgi:hypothetical protein